MPVRARIVLAGCLASIASFAPAGLARAADPTKDQCIDANESAQGLRKNMRFREAEQRLLVCVSASCPGPVRDDCAQRLSELRAVTPTIVFAAKDDADQDLSAVRVTMDGAVLAEKLDGAAIPLDPGEHRFVFEAAGHSTQERVVVVREGEKERHERILFLTVAPESPTEATTPVATPAPPPAATAHDGKGQRIAGLVIGGVGIGGLVAGGILGIAAKSAYDNALAGPCHGIANACTQEGVDGGDSAHTQALISTVAFIAGGAMVAGGAILFFTAPRGTDVTVSPTVGSGTAGLSVRGRW